MNGNTLKNHILILLVGCLMLAFADSEVVAQERLQPETLPAPLYQSPPQIQAQPLPTSTTHQLSVRIKDITRLKGARTNKLTGLGLVTGLNGTGSKSPVTRQFALNLLERFDLRASPQDRANIRLNALDKTDNLSVVTVTAEVNSLVHQTGNRIDVTVSTFDDAKSLQGGVLMLTPLYGVDGEVYAVASGAVSIGGFSFSGDAASVQQNHPTTGRIPDGGTIEKALCEGPADWPSEFQLNLKSPDLETASRIVNAINQFWTRHAIIQDAGKVLIRIPDAHRRMPHHFIALVQSIRVVPDEAARVVINERTGTIIVGANVRLSKVAISHANLSVITGETPQVAQPAPFSDGVTAVVPRTEISVSEERRPIGVIDEPVTVGELARALNALGVTPRDLSSIFQQLKVSGALHATLDFQ